MNREITIQRAIEVYYVLKGIIDNTTYNIDSLCKFKLLGLMKCLQSYVNDFDVIKNELIVKYGKEKDDGQFFVDKDDTDTIKKINEELTPVLNNKVTPNVDLFKPEDIFDKGIPSEYMISLYEFIED